METGVWLEDIPKTEVLKPKVLYHASQNRNIKVFEPRAETVRDPEEGPVVFATPHKEVAVCFMTPYEFHHGSFNRGESWFMVIPDKGEYLAKDKGGAIYSLPSDSFKADSQRGLKENEWTSKVAVKPADKEEYDSTLNAMLDQSVQVYFVDRQTYADIRSSDDHGFKIVSGLKSENQERNLNIKSLDVPSP